MTANLVDDLDPPQPAETVGQNSVATAAVGPQSHCDVPPRIFVIDDEEGICKFISLTMVSLGLKPEIFFTAGDAIAALEGRQPALIFLDIALKGSDAIEVIRTLGDRRFTGVVQVMSGSNQDLLDDVRRVGERHGLTMRPPLEKPFRSDAVRQVIASLQLDITQTAPAGPRPANTLRLEDVIANGWLELWYQPKFDLRTNMIVGAEGLIRCRHPMHGVLSPACFMPDASEKSLEALTEYVVVTALRDWQHTGIRTHIAVNTSARSLANLHLPAIIRNHRPQDKHWPGLIVEITESEAARDMHMVHEIATQLRIYGITFAIDDFGEGYSSFARLRELPFGELKLDASFVKGCASDKKNAGICQAIVELAHHYGATAVAEGIENAADLAVVKRLGCEMGQGYFLARPMPRAEFASLIAQHSAGIRAVAQ